MLSRFNLTRSTTRTSATRLTNLLVSSRRFCSSETAAAASSSSKEMNEFLSLLNLRGLCTTSMNTRMTGNTNNTSSLLPSSTTSNENQTKTSNNEDVLTKDDEEMILTSNKAELVNKTNNNFLFCSTCQKRFSSPVSLQKHISVRHDKISSKRTKNNNNNNNNKKEHLQEHEDDLILLAERWSRLVARQTRTGLVSSISAEATPSSSTSTAKSEDSKETTEETKQTINNNNNEEISSSSEKHQQKIRQSAGAGGIVLTDTDRRDLLQAQIDLVDSATEALIAWAQRNEKRKYARSKENNSILLPSNNNSTSSSSLSSNSNQNNNNNTLVSSVQSPFFISKRHPYGNNEYISIASRKSLIHNQQQAFQKQVQNNSKKSQQQQLHLPPPPNISAMNVCDVGGMTSCSLIGVVTSVKTGTMKSLTAPQHHQHQATSGKKNEDSKNDDSNEQKSQSSPSTAKPVHPQRATILEVACRNFQCDKVSGRVSMMKNNITVRIRERVENNKNKKVFGENFIQDGEKFNIGDVLSCKGQLQLHALYDLATKKWQTNGLVVDVCRNSRNGEVVKLVSAKYTIVKETVLEEVEN